MKTIAQHIIRMYVHMGRSDGRSANVRGRYSPAQKLSRLDEGGWIGPVYHGTSGRHFRAFDTSGEGVHFGTREQAEGRLRGKTPGGGRPKIIAAHIRLANPLRLPDIGTWNHFQNLHRELSVGGHITDQEADAAWDAWQRSDAEGWEALKRALEANGHDGIVYENELEGPGESYIVFRPNQIRIVHRERLSMRVRRAVRLARGGPVRLNRETVRRLYDHLQLDKSDEARWHALADAVEEAGRPVTADMLRLRASIKTSTIDHPEWDDSIGGRLHWGLTDTGTTAGMPVTLCHGRTHGYIVFGPSDTTGHGCVYVPKHISDQLRAEMDSPEQMSRPGGPVRLNRETIARLWDEVKADAHDDARWHALADAFEEAGKPHTAAGLRLITEGNDYRGSDGNLKFGGLHRRTSTDHLASGLVLGVPVYVGRRAWFHVANIADRQGSSTPLITDETRDGIVQEIDEPTPRTTRPARFNRETINRLAAAVKASPDARVGRNMETRQALADALEEAGRTLEADAVRSGDRLYIHEPHRGNADHQIKREYRGLFFDAGTAKPVMDIIADHLHNGVRLHVSHGFTEGYPPSEQGKPESELGRDWLEEYGCHGTIGCTTGMRSPLMVATSRSMGGDLLSTDNIVRIRSMPSGRILYQHPAYHHGTVELRAYDPPMADHQGVPTYTHGIMVDGQNHANFRSELAARRFVKKLGITLSSEPKRLQARELIRHAIRMSRTGNLQSVANRPVRLNRETVRRLYEQARLDPHTDAHWHALADALEEAGKPETAGLIREAVQHGRKGHWGRNNYPHIFHNADNAGFGHGRDRNIYQAIAGMPVEFCRLGQVHVLRIGPTEQWAASSGNLPMMVRMKPERGQRIMAEFDPPEAKGAVKMNRETIGRLFEQVKADPHTDAHWHALADALDEAGKPHTAQAIRELGSGENAQTRPDGGAQKFKAIWNHNPNSPFGRVVHNQGDHDLAGTVAGLPIHVGAYGWVCLSPGPYVVPGVHYALPRGHLNAIVSEFDDQPSVL